MLTGELRNQIDTVWNSFWSGGIANPLEVIEQITYLLFLRRLDELQMLEENKATRFGRPIERKIFPNGKDTKGKLYQDFRWSRIKNMAPAEMFIVVSEHVFPFIREMGDGSTYSKMMQGARFTIPTAALLAKVVDLLDQIPMEDRDTKGDLYEYMLSKIATAGTNGQFRTPRHIIALMVELTGPTSKDVICDPASGTCGFLVGAGEYLRTRHPELFTDNTAREHFHGSMFHGYDFDNTMLRIGSMNMLLHGVENPAISYRDSLSQDYAIEEEQYSLILANPPFAGSLDYEGTAKDLLAVVKTKKTELLFLALFLKLLKPGGRAAVIVPDGILFGSSKAHRDLRRLLVEEQKLDAVISLPSGVFKPYAGVSTAILLFTKTNSGGTDHVWFYDMLSDGYSLNDNRRPLLEFDKLGACPSAALSIEDLSKNNLPDIVSRWAKRGTDELGNSRTNQSFNVPKAEIAKNGYDLSFGRYRKVLHDAIVHVPATQLIDELQALEGEMREDLRALRKAFHTLDHLLKNSRDWPVVELGSLCTRITDGTHQSPKWESAGVPFLFISNIVDGKIIFETKKFISSSTHEELTRRCPIEVGDILYTTVGSYGNVAVVDTSRKFAFQRHIAHLKPNHKKANVNFLAWMITTPWVRRQVDAVARGVAQKTVNLADIKSLRVLDIPMEIQDEYAKVLVQTSIVRDRYALATGKSSGLSEAIIFSSLKRLAGE